MKNLKQDKLPEEVVPKKIFQGYKDKRSEWGKLRAIRLIYGVVILFSGMGCIYGTFGLFSGEANYLPLGFAFIWLFFFINLFGNISKKMKLFEQEIKTDKAYKRESQIIIRIVLFLILFIMIAILFSALY